MFDKNEAVGKKRGEFIGMGCWVSPSSRDFYLGFLSRLKAHWTISILCYKL